MSNIIQTDTAKMNQLSSPQEDLSLVDILFFARRRWLVIFVPALIAAMATAVIVATRAPIYQSTATLNVPSEATPEIKRVLPTPQAYQLLLESPAIKDELARRLKTKQIALDNTNYILRARMAVASQPTLLEAIVESPAAELAIVIAKEWCDLFQERIQQIVAEAIALKEQSDKAKRELYAKQIIKLQEQLLPIEHDFIKKCDDLVQRFEKLKETQPKDDHLTQQYDLYKRTLFLLLESRLTNLYSNISAKQKLIDDLETGLAKDSQSEAHLIISAVALAQPQSQGIAKYALFGLFGGLLLGIMLAVVLEVCATKSSRSS